MSRAGPQVRQDRRRGRRTSPADDAAGLFDAHAAALLGLASVLLESGAAAQQVLEHMLVEAAGARRHAESAEDGEQVRRMLARRVYRRCATTRHDVGSNAGSDAGSRDTGPPDGSMEVLERARLSFQQRAAIGLSVYGSHTYREVAEVMRLPPEVVAELQRSGLHRLRDTL